MQYARKAIILNAGKVSLQYGRLFRGRECIVKSEFNYEKICICVNVANIFFMGCSDSDSAPQELIQSTSVLVEVGRLHINIYS